jgi:hypothetical protein
MRYILLTLLLIGLSKPLAAQEDTLRKQVFGAYVIVPFEFPLINANALNTELNTLGYPSLDYPRPAIGIGLQYYINGVIARFSYNQTTAKAEEDTYTTEIQYRSTSFNIGFDLTNSYWHSIYPYIGFKGTGLNYLYRDKTAEELTFEQYFQSGLTYREMAYSRFNLDVGLGFSTQWFYLINFRAGYLLPLEGARWKINNNQVLLQNSPALQYNYYFTITLGLGNISGKRNTIRREPAIDRNRPQMAHRYSN